MAKRINISVSDSVYITLKAMSDDYGIPLSSLGSMAMMTFLEQKQAMVAMGDIKGIMSQISQLNLDGVASLTLQNKEDKK